MPASDRIVGWRAYGGVLVVEVAVRGGSAKMLVDTGCAITSITTGAADRLGLDRGSFSGRREVFTAGGSHLLVPTGRIAVLRVGTAELRDVEIALIDLPPHVELDGLLGVNVLARFRATFDFRRATLVLRPEPLR